jgi:hypothetical protein
MRLTLDASLFDGDASPGIVWTQEPANGGAPARKLVDGVALRAIPAIDNDPLGTPDLGSGRNTRLFALSASPPGELPLLAAVSLRSDGGVEVRLVRPGVSATASGGQAPLFGVFTLTRQAGTCGF